jgi:hypothetical protein
MPNIRFSRDNLARRQHAELGFRKNLLRNACGPCSRVGPIGPIHLRYHRGGRPPPGVLQCRDQVQDRGDSAARRSLPAAAVALDRRWPSGRHPPERPSAPPWPAGARGAGLHRTRSSPPAVRGPQSHHAGSGCAGASARAPTHPATRTAMPSRGRSRRHRG